ncbi:MAG: SDR family oxidoreductase [Deltaproteobacteria bacterium]|nr:SDR family oxidoreductase [Deltaproteobacteria bacterium]
MDYKTMFSLKGKKAVVTGGTSGMGAAVAEGLAAFGGRVAVTGRNRERGQTVVNRIRQSGGEADFFSVEVTDPKSVEKMVEAVKDLYGRIDILVNAAGVFRVGPCESLSDEQWDEVIKTNLYGTFYPCRAVGRIMIEQKYGKIINFSSTDAYLGVQNQCAYCASKGAVNQLTRVLAVDWIKHGINVNAIGPCDFATPMIEPFLKTEEYRNWILSALPVGKVGQPPEIVGAAIYLASEASNMVVGHTLMVDGGRTVI